MHTCPTLWGSDGVTSGGGVNCKGEEPQLDGEERFLEIDKMEEKKCFFEKLSTQYL